MRGVTGCVLVDWYFHEHVTDYERACFAHELSGMKEQVDARYNAEVMHVDVADFLQRHSCWE